jgi:hypothetical protein
MTWKGHVRTTVVRTYILINIYMLELGYHAFMVRSWSVPSDLLNLMLGYFNLACFGVTVQVNVTYTCMA